MSATASGAVVADKENEVRAVIEALIQVATTYDVAALDQIYHDDLHVVMVDDDGQVNTANKDDFKAMFASKHDAGDPPMNTWAKFHHIDVSDDKALVVLRRKNNLNGRDMNLSLSIDLIQVEDRWQVMREVIFLTPAA